MTNDVSGDVARAGLNTGPRMDLVGKRVDMRIALPVFGGMQGRSNSRRTSAPVMSGILAVPCLRTRRGVGYWLP